MKDVIKNDPKEYKRRYSLVSNPEGNKSANAGLISRAISEEFLNAPIDDRGYLDLSAALPIYSDRQMTNLHLVEIAQHHNGKPITFHALALRVGESWLWYPDPAVQIGDGQRVVRWKRVVDVEGWEE